MRYYKITNDDGFITASTLNAEGEGNSTKAEHDTIVEMYRNAPDGYGVIETEDGFAYAQRPVEPEPELDAAELVDILLGGGT